jgi:hypothetical protein
MSKVEFVTLKITDIPAFADENPEHWDWDEVFNDAEVTAGVWDEKSQLFTACVRAEDGVVAKSLPWAAALSPAVVEVIN